MLSVDVLVMVVMVIVMIEARLTDDYPQRVQLAGDVTRSRAVATAARNVFVGRRAFGENAQQRCSRRSRQLARSRRSVPHVESLEQPDGRRCGHWQPPVRRLHGSVAQRNPGVVDALDTEQLQRPDRADYIENRID